MINRVKLWRNLCDHKIAEAELDRSLALSDMSLYPLGSWGHAALAFFIAFYELKIKIWKALAGYD
jgi:hypothetical protein